MTTSSPIFARLAAAVTALVSGSLIPAGRGETLNPPPITVLKSQGHLAEGLIFISPQGAGQPDPSHPIGPGPEIIDNRGRPVWFSPVTAPGGVWAMDFQVQTYRGMPVLTWTEGTAFNVHPTVPTIDYILDASYNVVATIQAGNGLNANQHEFQLTPQNTALLAIYHLVPANLSSVGGATNGLVYEAVVQELDVATGKVLLEWHSLRDIPVTDSYKEPPLASTPEAEYDYFHLNSISLDTDGNLLISARHTWAIYKINRATGATMWRLGGKRSDFALGPGVAFAWQHHAIATNASTIRIFDNQSNGTPELPYSRIIWVKRDESAMTATLVKSFVHPEGLSAGFMGNAQALPNGDTFVGWGEPGRFSEFDTDGQLVFDAKTPDGYNTYRAYRSPWIGAPTTSPTATAEPNGDGTMSVHAIWNGATEVTTWQVLAGATPGSLAPVATAAWNGLDSTIVFRGPAAYVQVVALNSTGDAIGSSPVAAASVATGAPFITTQPVSQSVANGSAVVFTVAASSASPVNYQWYRNGTPVAGSTQASYAIPSVQITDAASYACVVTNAVGNVTSQPARLTLIPTARLTNLAVRTALAGNQKLTVGFTISGAGQNILLRAVGPGLAQFGLTAVVADPTLVLFQGSARIGGSDNWPAALAPAFAAAGAFRLPAGSHDAALLQNLNGSCSAQISGTTGGVVLAELYEADAGGRGRLVNLSAQNHVGAGGNILIAGFHIEGTGTLRVLIRAVGSSLTLFGVPNVLTAPKLALYDSSGLELAESVSWAPSLAATFSSVGAFPLTAGSKDAALLTTLSAGRSYTVEVSGVGGNTGAALVEIYEVP